MREEDQMTVPTEKEPAGSKMMPSSNVSSSAVSEVPEVRWEKRSGGEERVQT